MVVEYSRAGRLPRPGSTGLVLLHDRLARKPRDTKVELSGRVLPWDPHGEVFGQGYIWLVPGRYSTVGEGAMESSKVYRDGPEWSQRWLGES